MEIPTGIIRNVVLITAKPIPEKREVSGFEIFQALIGVLVCVLVIRMKTRGK